MPRRILITGCSGGGKSTLAGALSASGHSVIAEPGLRVIRGGGPKPWEDISEFFEAVTDLARKDLDEVLNAKGLIFFDRGLFDALSGKAERDKKLVSELLPGRFPYAEPVFYAPPWPEIFENTPERQLSFQIAEAEALRLRRDLDHLRVRTIELPRASLEDRLNLVLAELNLG